jgi:surface antigen
LVPVVGAVLSFHEYPYNPPIAGQNHVAIVEKVNPDGSFEYSEMNVRGNLADVFLTKGEKDFCLPHCTFAIPPDEEMA